MLGSYNCPKSFLTEKEREKEIYTEYLLIQSYPDLIHVTAALKCDRM